MSLSPHQIFGRLQELKKWQQTHEKLLQRSNQIDDNRKSHVNNQPFGLNKKDHNENSVTYENLDEQYVGAPIDKDFDELLEEKLNEYNEYEVTVSDPQVPKRPFLKKGTGLLKYNLKPEEYKSLIGNKYSNSIIRIKNRSKSTETKRKSVQFQTERPKSTGGASKAVTSSRKKNFVRSNRVSVSSQKPKATASECSGKRGTQNRLSNPRNVQIKNEPHKIQNKRNSMTNGDCLNRKSQEIKQDIKCHTEELKYGLQETIGDSKNQHKIETLTQKPNDKNESKRKPLHDFISEVVGKSADYTPLRVPEMCIKPKGNWCDFPDGFQNEIWKNMTDSSQKNGRIFPIDKNSKVMVHSHWKDASDDGKNTESECRPVLQEPRTRTARKSLSYTSNENSLYEKAVETELKIFEALERKTEQSGFCSTNTSILQLLASTPSKFNVKNSETNTDDQISNGAINENRKDASPREIDGEFEIEYDFSNWKYGNKDDDSDEETDRTLESQTNENKKECEEIVVEHFRDRKNSMTNTEILNSLSSYSSTSSDISSDYLLEASKAETPSNNRMVDSSESCSSCGFLIKNKIEECQSELENLKKEKDKIMVIKEKMERDREEFEKEMKLRRIQFEEQKLKYQLEIEEERQKMTEKREGSDKINKENTKTKMQQRKDREELNNLRMELNETKELMKLRDTKNAMSIARLRNQVKLLEKSNADLKNENEKLLKERSKLMAQQKMLTKTNETKMLKEISKNISKLAEESTKKMDSSTEDVTKKKVVHGGSRGDCAVNVRKNTQGILKNSQSSQRKEESIEAYPDKTQIINDKNIEEKYKSLFGGKDVILEENRKNDSSFGNMTRTVGLDKTERILDDGTKEIKYTNGNLKRISENGTVRYYYASNDTWHTNFPDGTEVIEFPNGQSEKRYKDGKCLIFFPDGLIQTIFPDGTEEVKYPDGSKLLTRNDGDRLLFLTNGQVEIHTKDQKRREYPDGTVKILYPDGSQETRYSNGRIRMKNSEGHVVLDTGEPNS